MLTFSDPFKESSVQYTVVVDFEWMVWYENTVHACVCLLREVLNIYSGRAPNVTPQ